MAYGQGMMLDSIRNVLNRRQAARAEDDQFQLAQDRGESALERLRAQADMSTARAQAQGESDLWKEQLRAKNRLDVADKRIEQAGVSADGYVRSAETRGQYDNQGRRITAEEQFKRQLAGNEWKSGENSQDRSSEEGINEARNKSQETQAWIRAQASENNTDKMVGVRAATSNDPVLKSMDAEIEGAQRKLGELYQKHLDNLVKAKFRTRQEYEQEAFRLAKIDAAAIGLDPVKIRETIKARNEYRAKIQGQPQQQSSETVIESKSSNSKRPALR